MTGTSQPQAFCIRICHNTRKGCY